MEELYDIDKNVIDFLLQPSQKLKELFYNYGYVSKIYSSYYEELSNLFKNIDKEKEEPLYEYMVSKINQDKSHKYLKYFNKVLLFSILVDNSDFLKREETLEIYLKDWIADCLSLYPEYLNDVNNLSFEDAEMYLLEHGCNFIFYSELKIDDDISLKKESFQAEFLEYLLKTDKVANIYSLKQNIFHL